MTPCDPITINKKLRLRYKYRKNIRMFAVLTSINKGQSDLPALRVRPFLCPVHTCNIIRRTAPVSTVNASTPLEYGG